MIICNSSDCFGCSLCHDICPHKAISINDSNGFYRPYIDDEKCTKCGLCKQLCPGNNIKIEDSLNYPSDCYAAWSKDKSIHFESSSGGLATEISKKFIENGGVVGGCIYDSNRQEAIHYLTSNCLELNRLSKSKYLLSNKTDFWNQLLKYKKLPILFIGVGCEVFAFKEYIKLKRFDNNQIFCIDLLCRGGASSLCFKQHLKKWAPDCDNVSFRGGVNDCKFTAYKKGNIIYQKGQYEDAFFSEFMRHSIFSPRCYTCPFARTERGGDLTLADFWGLNSEVYKKTNGHGVNLCLVNTDKGKDLLAGVLSKIELYKRPLDEAVSGNSTLYTPTDKAANIDNLWKLIPSVGFEKAVGIVYRAYYIKCFIIQFKKKIKPYIPEPIWNFLRTLKK